jgi:hypothetical protein
MTQRERKALRAAWRAYVAAEERAAFGEVEAAMRRYEARLADLARSSAVLARIGVTLAYTPGGFLA